MVSITSMFMLTFLTLATTGVVANDDCNYYGYKKSGCFKRDEKLFHELLITDLDPTHDKWGKDLDWGNFQESLQSLACRCEAKTRTKGFSYFAIGFYGECWAGSNKAALRKKILTPGPHSS